MKSAALVVVLLAGLTVATVPAQAQMYQTVEQDQAQLLQADPGKLYCPNCGMNLVTFYRTGHALVAADGVTHQYCSLHCLVEANPTLEGQPLVVDNTGLQFIPADQAFYVVGSSKPGTMTMNSKYAFAGEAAAQAFAAANGGQVMTFTAAVEIARAGLTGENAMIDKKRALAAEKGQAIFAKMHNGTPVPVFTSIAEAKTYLADTGVCGNLKDEQYQAVALYLVRRQSGEQTAAVRLEVPAKEKCPVCGMFVAKYPKWAAMAELKDGRKFWFDGVKDLMKFYLQADRYNVMALPTDFAGLAVTDYYTLAAVPAEQAWFVTGSNVFGPMGNELVPFASEEDARTFLEDHFGERVLMFTEITAQLVHDLDK